MNITKRQEIISCADSVIDTIGIVERVFDTFGHDLDGEVAERISNLVYEQVKLRM